MVYIRDGKLEQGEMRPEDRESAVGFRGWIKAEVKDGETTADGQPVLPAEAGRYHLVVSAGCPFCHRTTLLRALKGLEGAVSVGYTLPPRDPEHGFLFPAPGVRDERYLEATEDLSGEGFCYVHEFYTASPGSVTTAASVPVLWDRRTKRIVSNDSGDIATMFATEFGAFTSGAPTPDYYPPALRSEIDALSQGMNKRVNGGVYHAGFQSNQEGYETECKAVFEALQELNDRLASRRYLINNIVAGYPEPTMADWRLYATLARFDPVYYSRFKLNLRYLRGFPNLQAYFEDLQSDPRVAATTMFGSLKDGYHRGQVGPLPPESVVPRGATPFTVRAPDARRQLGLPSTSGSHAAGTQEKESGKPTAVKGAFVRPVSAHRNRITADGSSGLKAEAGRYHLYIANNCPWCHRTALTRAILGLQQAVSMDVLFYRRDPDRGWKFNQEEEGCTEDTAAGGIKFIRDLYEREGSAEKSVPVLWDKKTQKIVSNESADIIRMFATAFGEFQRSGAPKLFPADLAQQIEDINASVYDDIANGAYKAGFAKSQEAYEIAYHNFFRALDRVEGMLSSSRFLCGDALTEADVRLFPTMFRFDNVYHLRFKLNEALISESYPHLQRWLEEVYAVPGVAEASSIRHCKLGYFGRSGNNIIPLGPELAFKFKQ